jgi:hypothetical protein
MNANEVLRVENAVFILENNTRVSGFLKDSLSRKDQMRKNAFSIGVRAKHSEGGGGR